LASSYTDCRVLPTSPRTGIRQISAVGTHVAAPNGLERRNRIRTEEGSMRTLLIVYGSTEGQARKVASHMAAIAREDGVEVTEVDAASVPTRLAWEQFDAAVVGASVHQGRHQDAVVAFVRENLSALRRIPTAFFSVCLEAALPGEEHQDEARRYIGEFIRETGWEPGMTQSVAGALRYSQYDYFTRLAMKFIARRKGIGTTTSTDYEYTDWDEVGRFMTGFLTWAASAPAAPQAHLA
jgi:menaquinone-dependent protoporphyrinogen oxidase